MGRALCGLVPALVCAALLGCDGPRRAAAPATIHSVSSPLQGTWHGRLDGWLKQVPPPGYRHFSDSLDVTISEAAVATLWDGRPMASALAYLSSDSVRWVMTYESGQRFWFEAEPSYPESGMNVSGWMTNAELSPVFCDTLPDSVVCHSDPIIGWFVLHP